MVTDTRRFARRGRAYNQGYEVNTRGNRLKWHRLTYNVYYADGGKYYNRITEGAREFDSIEDIKNGFKDTCKIVLDFMRGDNDLTGIRVITGFKLISIDGQKVNITIN